MNEEDIQTGTLQTRPNGDHEGHLTRIYENHDCPAVWKMLTEPGSLAQWLAPGTIEPRQGGAVKIDFEDSGQVIESTVLAFESGRQLAYSWSRPGEPERLLRWTLKPVENGTRLTLVVGIPAGEDAAKACAGFEGHLEMLGAALEGVPMKFPVDLYLKARGAYSQQLAD